MNRNLLVAAALVAFSAVAAGAWVITRPATGLPEVTEFTATEAQSEVAENLPEVLEMSIGNPQSNVTVTEYASFTCPHCRSFHKNAFGELKENYIDTGKINFVYREVYFDKFGLWAGMVARCAGPERYFGISDLLYEKQSEWLASRNDAGIAADLRKLGLAAGIGAEELETCLNDGDKARALVATFQENAAADDISSTPSFIINGKKYSNMNYTDFAAILDEELGE